jgi:IMP dehydrogenase
MRYVLKKTYTFDDVSIQPEFSTISSRSNCNVETKLSRNFKMRIPIIATPMDTITETEMGVQMDYLGGLGIIHRFMSIEEQCKMVTWINHDGHVGIGNTFQKPYLPENVLPKVIGAAIGVNNIERARALLKAGANLLMIDVAHADHQLVLDMIELLVKLKDEYDFDILAGTIATSGAAKRLIKAGVDGLVVGVGGGSLCETRIRAGVGIPMITSISDVADAIEFMDPEVSLIATGGMRTPGDVAKAIAAGADCVMLGSMLAGTRETPGAIHKSGTYGKDVLFKSYRGSASPDSKRDRGETKNVEGNSTTIPYRGSVVRIVNEIIEGLQSSMSYVGTDSMGDFKAQAILVEISQSGVMEAKPHLLH